MDVKTWFEAEIAPCVRADGGWLELTDVQSGTAAVTAKGECARCAALDRCLRWAEMKARQETGTDIRFTAKREPFLWRK